MINDIKVEVTLKSRHAPGRPNLGAHIVDTWDRVENAVMLMDLNGALRISRVIDGDEKPVAYYAPDAWLKFEVVEWHTEEA